MRQFPMYRKRVFISAKWGIGRVAAGDFSTPVSAAYAPELVLVESPEIGVRFALRTAESSIILVSYAHISTYRYREFISDWKGRIRGFFDLDQGIPHFCSSPQTWRPRSSVSA